MPEKGENLNRKQLQCVKGNLVFFKLTIKQQQQQKQKQKKHEKLYK